MPLHLVTKPKRTTYLFTPSLSFCLTSSSASPSPPRHSHFSLHSLFFTTNSYNSQPEEFQPTIPSSPKHHSLHSYYATLLQSCIARKAIEPGKQLHAHLYQMSRGFSPFLANKLVSLYTVCDSLHNAHQLFDRIPRRNLFLLNGLIRGYAWNGPYEAAISLYYQMFDYGLMPNKFTFPFVLKACSALSAIEKGQDIHEQVIKTGCETDKYVAAALIDMYAKCGCVESARQVFEKVEERDDVLWNSMLSAYSQNGHPDDSMSLCSEMALAGLRPTEATFVTVISSSADVAALPQGKELHCYSLRQGFATNDKVKTALIDMYAKSGLVKVARIIFDSLKEKRVVSWNAMITGYSMHGYATEALKLFGQMKEEKFSPDHITFVGALAACSHGGLLNEGRKLFESMVRDYGINPTVEHYTCMIDLLGRFNRLDEAYNLIMHMRVVPDSGVWGALLNSCKIHGDVQLGELALEKLIQLEPEDAGNYVILSNLYAQAGKWEGVTRLRKLMIDMGIKKSVACSWIEVKNRVHGFLSGDTSHSEYDAICAELKRLGKLMKEAGYEPQTGTVFHDVEDDEKTNMVCGHSERLAIAFGLISTAPGTGLLITKNLRICEDCHVAIKFISKITKREITIRDVNRYHHFKDGVCSCGDYW